MLTLPWSLVTLLFMWALMHGAGLGCFSVMYVLFGALNAYIIYRACVAFRNRERPPGWRK